MKAKSFLNSLDTIRSAARTLHGMGESAISKSSPLIAQLKQLLTDLENERETKETLEIVRDASGAIVMTPELKAALGAKANSPAIAKDEEDSPTAPMRVEAIPRDPSTLPNKDIKVEQATAETVADKDELLATVGD